MAATGCRHDPELMGGVVVEVRHFGLAGALSRIWTVDPISWDERVVFVMRAEEMPKVGDDAWWWPDEDVVWAERDSGWRGRMLLRIGRCFDPLAEKVPLRDGQDC